MPQMNLDKHYLEPSRWWTQKHNLNVIKNISALKPLHRNTKWWLWKILTAGTCCGRNAIYKFLPKLSLAIIALKSPLWGAQSAFCEVGSSTICGTICIAAVECGWPVLWWMPLDLTDDKSTLVQVTATSHYLSQCWPRSMSPYDVTRPQWVNLLCYQRLPVSERMSRCQHYYVSMNLKNMIWRAEPKSTQNPCNFVWLISMRLQMSSIIGFLQSAFKVALRLINTSPAVAARWLPKYA